MGSYRSYMRSDYPEEKTSVLTWLLCSLVAGYLMQMTLLLFLDGSYLLSYLELSPLGLRNWHLWSLLTYAFLHSPDNLLHLLFSLLTLYFLGRELVPELGSRKFLWLYSACAVLGGLVYCGVHWNHPLSSVVGASAALSGLFVVYSCIYPDRQITTLFLFFPVTLPKTKYLAYALLAIDLFGLVFAELTKGGAYVAHSAHLGGMLCGFLFFKFFVSSYPWRLRMPWPRSQVRTIQPDWLSKARKAQVDNPRFEVNIMDRAHIKAEVDRILDKINSQGFASLTPEEKKTLDDARDLLSKP